MSLSSSNYILKPTALYLWTFSLSSSLPQSESILDEEEKKRAQRFYFDKHKRRFATARTRVREILGLYLQQAPEDLEFTYGAQGKPELLQDRNMHFNVSHTGDLGILAVSQYPVGVDIERYSARPYTGIGDHLFSEMEKQALAATHISARPALFFRIWTQKEAFIKANGLGLSYPLHQITVPLEGSKPVLLEDTLHQQTWKIQHFMSNIGVSSAFCCHPDIVDIHIEAFPKD